METAGEEPLRKLDRDPDPGETPAPWWKCVVAALPDLLLGLQFLVVASTSTWRSPSALLQLGARYIVCFVLFILAPKVFGAPGNVNEWAGLDSVLRGGALYFLVLGALELSGFYLRFIPRHARGFLTFWRGG